MTLEQKLHKALVGIREEGPCKYVGICANLDERLDCPLDYSYLLNQLFRKWPKFSGSTHFPIPGAVRYYKIAMEKGTLWDKRTKYGRLRWELLDWLIEQTAPEKKD